MQIDGDVSGTKPASAIDSCPSDSGVSTQLQRKNTYAMPALCMQANLIPSPLRAVLGLQRATCSMQLASCKRPTSDTQKCNIQDATNMVAAMQHTTRCMPTPALVLVAFCRPRNVNVVAWECRIYRLQCLTLAAFLCYWRAKGKRTSEEPITRTKITTRTNNGSI